VLLFIRFLREGKGIGRTEDGENGAEKNGGGWYLAMKKGTPAMCKCIGDCTMTWFFLSSTPPLSKDEQEQITKWQPLLFLPYFESIHPQG
jgi:hypothetical protein